MGISQRNCLTDNSHMIRHFEPLLYYKRFQSPPTKPADQSWESLKDAMKKLSEIAQGEKKKSPQK